MKEREKNVLDFGRKYVSSKGSTLEMIEVLCSRIRYYQRTPPKETIYNEKLKKNEYVPESHPDFDEVVTLIYWVADFMPTNEYPWRIDIIKNQLFTAVGL